MTSNSQTFSTISTCGGCGAKNRIPAAHLSDAGRCGSCKSAIAPLGRPLEVDAHGFDAILGSAKVPVLVDFWASWCGPCKMAAPEVEKVAREMAGKAVVLKVNTEEQPALASRFRVQSIPNFIVFFKGQPVMQQPGMVPAAQMKRWLEQAAA